MEELNIDKYMRLTSDEYKACAGCHFRFKDKGTLSRQKEEDIEDI